MSAVTTTMTALEPVLDTAALSIIATSTFATLQVTTRNSRYLVVIRPNGVVVVCPDLVTLQGTHVHMVRGSLFLRDDSDDRTLLRTTQVQHLYVLEN